MIFQVGDRQEVGAIVEVFCKGRTSPLLIGALKSNMGHGEPASALSAVIKVLVAMECRLLPPNLHYRIPNPDIPALVDGRLTVSTNHHVNRRVLSIEAVIVQLLFFRYYYKGRGKRRSMERRYCCSQLFWCGWCQWTLSDEVVHPAEKRTASAGRAIT